MDGSETGVNKGDLAGFETNVYCLQTLYTCMYTLYTYHAGV